VAKVPSFILSTLYEKGSLINTADGCAFALQNKLGTGTVIRFDSLEIDGSACPPERVSVSYPGASERRAADVGPEAALPLTVGVKMTVQCAGVWLQAGKHRITLRVQTMEMGELEIKATDELSAGRGADAEERGAGVHEDERAVPVQPAARPIKVAILGAGSTVFAQQLMTDLLCTPGLEEGTIALVDIDGERLDLAHRLGEKLVEKSGRDWMVQATTDRQQMLAGCDYVINTIEVAGLRNVRPDYEIPLKYGVDQCIGDTIGPGGIFKMLRTGPTWLEILRDVERQCPGAVVMNYTNPMSALTLLALRATRLAVVGLCHSVQGTARRLASYLDVPYEELRFQCAGINHMAWFTELRYQGEDMYPRLRRAARDPEIYESDPMRFEMLMHFGAFVTESSGHFSEYVPYFRKRPDLLQRYAREGYLGESGFYAKNWPQWRAEATETSRKLLAGEREIILNRSSEYASGIVEAIETDKPAVIHGNVLNSGLIHNLPDGGCVEVPVLVDGTGLHPVNFGALPPQLAALNAAHMYVHELMVQAVLECDRGAALRALMLDPLTAAVCSPDEIRQMFEEMWEAQRAALALFEA
jgi:alpha-galactosidase